MAKTSRRPMAGKSLLLKMKVLLKPKEIETFVSIKVFCLLLPVIGATLSN